MSRYSVKILNNTYSRKRRRIGSVISSTFCSYQNTYLILGVPNCDSVLLLLLFLLIVSSSTALLYHLIPPERWYHQNLDLFTIPIEKKTNSDCSKFFDEKVKLRSICYLPNVGFYGKLGHWTLKYYLPIYFYFIILFFYIFFLLFLEILINWHCSKLWEYLLSWYQMRYLFINTESIVQEFRPRVCSKLQDSI